MTATPPRPLAGARLLFSLDPAIAHLNHGAFGAVPLSVQRAQQRLRDEVESNPVRFFTTGLQDRIVHTRKHVAGFLGADPDGTALVGNATAAASIALHSVSPRAGDEIVLTDHGYGAVAIAVERWCRRTGARSRVVPVPVDATDDHIVDAVQAAVTRGRTRLVIVDQITSPTARLLPVARITAALRATDVPVFVDAAHVPGMLPVRVDDLGADFWVGNLHKWAFAPRGTAAFVVSPRWRDRVEPLVVSWDQDAGFPLNVESQGTLDYTPWLAAPAGLHVLRTLGLDEVRSHNTVLAAYGQRLVGAALGLSPAELPDPGGPLSMRILPLPAGLATNRDDASALRRRIATELAAEVVVLPFAGRGFVRLSAQIYNRPEEYERLAERLPTLLRTA